MHIAPRQVHVRVPATTANLGSGFDILGLALQLYNVFTLTITSEPGWRVSLPAGIALPADDRNLVFQAARALFTRVGATPPGLHLALTMDIPLARGLGSSSSAIVGGLLAANQLTGNTLDRSTLLTMAVAIEGHPDNVTPALIGGLTLSYTVEAQQRYLSLPFPPELTLVVAIPDFELSTAQARAVLPAQVSRADALFNCSRTALLVHILYSRQYELLATAMDDRLHQPYRAARSRAWLPPSRLALPPVPAASLSVGLAPRSWLSPIRPQMLSLKPCGRLLRTTVSPAPQGCSRLTQQAPWHGRRPPIHDTGEQGRRYTTWAHSNVVSSCGPVTSPKASSAACRALMTTSGCAGATAKSLMKRASPNCSPCGPWRS